MKRLARRVLIAGGTTALAAAAFAAPASVQAADPPVPVCLSVTVVDLIDTAEQLCQGGAKDTR